eukprot:2533563-Heterocapsa_arctica.AAC.1
MSRCPICPGPATPAAPPSSLSRRLRDRHVLPARSPRPALGAAPPLVFTHFAPHHAPPRLLLFH